MFIVKAEIKSGDYRLFNCERVSVRKYSVPQSVGVPTSANDPEREVWLYDNQNHELETLYVGNGLEQYSAVYIMNAQGKTVDSVYPGPSDVRVAA